MFSKFNFKFNYTCYNYIMDAIKTSKDPEALYNNWLLDKLSNKNNCSKEEFKLMFNFCSDFNSYNKIGKKILLEHKKEIHKSI